MAPALTLLSLGHSTLPLAEFLALLAEHDVRRLVDVRRNPVSRRHPHFAREALAPVLARAGVQYVHLPELGGLREERPGSAHVALPVGAFRGYADHMTSVEFARGVERLLALARERTTAVMCAEKRVEDCHRKLLSDRLLLTGASVVHVRPDAPPAAHVLHPAARVVDGRLVYAGTGQLELFE